MKVPFIIYADMESLLEKMSTCHNNPKESSTTKISKHTPSGYSLFTYSGLQKLRTRSGAGTCQVPKPHRGAQNMRHVVMT